MYIETNHLIPYKSKPRKRKEYLATVQLSAGFHLIEPLTHVCPPTIEKVLK